MCYFVTVDPSGFCFFSLVASSDICGGRHFSWLDERDIFFGKSGGRVIVIVNRDSPHLRGFHQLLISLLSVSQQAQRHIGISILHYLYTWSIKSIFRSVMIKNIQRTVKIIKHIKNKIKYISFEILFFNAFPRQQIYPNLRLPKPTLWSFYIRTVLRL